MKRLLRCIKAWLMGLVLLERLPTNLPPTQLPDSLDVTPSVSPEIGVGHKVGPGRLYELFEDVFRGSKDEISDRQRRYLPYLDRAVDATGGRLPVLDVGAGRGEFLALLTARGIPCRAVELNSDEMDFLTAEAREIVAGHDFLITVGLFDANPTTVLEAMGWGLIPVCTPQSGYYRNSGVVNVPANDAAGAVSVLEELNHADETVLVQMQRENRDQIASHFNWDRRGPHRRRRSSRPKPDRWVERQCAVAWH